MTSARPEGCKCLDIPVDVLFRVIRKSPLLAGIKERLIAVSTLKMFIDAGGNKLETVCFRHLSALASHLGFQVKKLSTRMLRERICQYWEYRDNTDAFKTAKVTLG